MLSLKIDFQWKLHDLTSGIRSTLCSPIMITVRDRITITQWYEHNNKHIKWEPPEAFRNPFEVCKKKKAVNFDGGSHFKSTNRQKSEFKRTIERNPPTRKILQMNPPTTIRFRMNQLMRSQYLLTQPTGITNRPTRIWFPTNRSTRI